jgi:hypothetical protein
MNIEYRRQALATIRAKRPIAIIINGSGGGAAGLANSFRRQARNCGPRSMTNPSIKAAADASSIPIMVRMIVVINISL